MAGNSKKSKGDRASDTLMSPAPPEYGLDASGAELKHESGLGPRSSQRTVPQVTSNGPEDCLSRHEVFAYLARACPKELRARVDTHVAGCVGCGQWVRHLDDDILEYMGGQRPEDELARMDAHLDACNACRELMHHVVQGMAQSWSGENTPGEASSTTFAPGAIVNARYRINGFVGRGGMGEVYDAYDQLMDRRIALKTVLCTAADRPRAARRFKEEVRNAQRVGHPHVCRINDLQEHRGDTTLGLPLPFLTMEFIDGERLGNRLDRGPLPLEEARSIALQLLSGLEAAHERGVLHLDFKSDNVMLRRNSTGPDAVIMDFGLSRVQGSESRLRTSDRRQFAGTLSHMAVEQLECRDVLGPPTDVYAFGVVLYELLTRSLPFEGDSLGAILLRQLKERPKPPSRRAGGLSPELDRFVLKCLHNNPRLRFADAGAALVALKEIRSWSDAGSRGRWRRAAIPLAAVALAAATLPLFLRPSTPADSAPPAAPTSEPAPTGVQQLTHELAPTPAPAATPVTAAATAEPAPAASTVAPAAARVPVAAARRTKVTPAPRELRAPAAAAVDGTSAAALPPEPRPSAAGTPGDPNWKPSKVPKRLRAPAPGASAEPNRAP